MRVATWNVHRCRGPAGLFRPDRVLAVLAEIRPDLVALQEAQRWLLRGRAMLDAAALLRDLGLRPLPVAERPDHQGWRSNVVLVRQDAVLLRPPEGLRLGGLEPRGAVLAELDLGEGPFRLLAAHLSLGAARRRAQAEALLAAALRPADPPLPTLLLGDLNERRADGAALAVLAPAFGVPPRAPTYPSFLPLASLDRVMAHPPGQVRELAVHDTPLARRASDHLPLVARVELGAVSPPAAAPEAAAPARG